MKKCSLFFAAATLSATPETTLLSSFAHALTLLSHNEPAPWPPASFVDWLKKENLISAEHELSGIPNGITAGFYRVRVMPQMGATCSVHSWYNLAWVTLLLNAETLQKAKHAASMIRDKAKFEKICTPIREKLSDLFLSNLLKKEVIDQLPAESKKYFTGYSFKNVLDDFFSYEKLPLFHDLFIQRKQGAYGFHWHQKAFGGHDTALVAARMGNAFSFFILDSLATEGSLDNANVALYEPFARDFIDWCLHPEKIHLHALERISEITEGLSNDSDTIKNSSHWGEKTIKEIEDRIAILDSVDRSIFDPSRKAYEQIRDTRIAEWQKTNPAITLDTIREIDLRKRR